MAAMRAAAITLYLLLLTQTAQATFTQQPGTEQEKQPPSTEKTAEQRRVEAENALARAVEQAGNDRAALVRNLEAYLAEFPDAPRKMQVYRALVEALLQLREYERGLEYVERIIALNPDDTSMMLLAVDLLEQMADDHSLAKAVGYVTRVLDLVEKSPRGEKPPRISLEEWELDRKRLLMSVYLIRGRLELSRRNYDAAARDLHKSYDTLPTPAAALQLGEIAEIQGDYVRAIEFYTLAFVLPDEHGLGVNRFEVRQKLGNVWRLVHGSQAGLGEHLLAAYDRVHSEAAEAAASVRNSEAATPFDHVLRRLGGDALHLEELKGKVVVMNFWATWCGPCRELEPLLEHVQQEFESRNDVVFLAVNVDEDESRVPPYVEREKVKVPVVFADGLNRFLGVEAIPTVVVFDRRGKMIYRGEGFDAANFVTDLTNAIRAAVNSR
jgi:thiol-disulfide isomerase/thioredoxin